MPIIKTNILGSDIDINYDQQDREKLISLITTFKKRLDEFPANGRISNNKIIFLAALKAENQIIEFKKLSEENIENNRKLIIQKNIIEDLNNKIFLLEDKIKEWNLKNLSEEKNNDLINNEIDVVKNRIDLIQNKIKNSIK